MVLNNRINNNILHTLTLFGFDVLSHVVDKSMVIDFETSLRAHENTAAEIFLVEQAAWGPHFTVARGSFSLYHVTGETTTTTTKT